MNLSEYIELLQKQDPAKEVKNGLGNPHSWRGSYDELAFEPVGKTTFGLMLDAAKSALNETYCGYKGGEFKMTGDTEVNIEFSGSWSDGVTLESMVEEFGVKDNDPLDRLIGLMART